MKKGTQQRKGKKTRIIITAILAGAALVCLIGAGILYYLQTRPTVLENVTLEAGQEIDIAQFLEKGADPSKASFEEGEVIDTGKVGVDLITINYKKKDYIVCVEIKDTVAPQGTPVAVTAKPEDMPEAADCVKDIVDVTAVEASFKEEINMSQAGETSVVVVLTDEGGNTTELTVPVTVILDSEPPVIEGTKDIVVYVGDTVSYRSGVSVTDNKDENPTLEIDNSQVNLEKVGEYPVTYTATDAAGNTSSVSITVTVAKKPQQTQSTGGSSNGSSGQTQVDSGDMNALAQKVYNQIIKDDMSQMQKAFAIYRWVRTNIGYTGSSEKSSWEVGAYQAFKNRSGDCFNYYAAGKALLNIAGIQNVDIVKSDTSHSRHYWSLINVGTGWYHFDCTPRKGGGNFFMLTDAELADYSESHKNSHIFDSSLYPARATESVQGMVNYNKGTVSQ